MKNIFAIIAVAIIAVFVVGAWYISGLNKAVKLDEAVNSAWAQVENQLQRRNDLIPNLVNTVKGYAHQEKEVFLKVAELRSQWGKASTVAEKIDNANQMTAALSRLLMISENYPEVKSNQNFLALQNQLEGTENRIAVERMRYNEAVNIFNTYRRTVFGGFFAARRGVDKPKDYFKAEETAKGVPEVKF